MSNDDRGYRVHHSNDMMEERGGYRGDNRGDNRGPSRRGRHDDHRFNSNTGRRRDEYRQNNRYHPEDDDNKRRRLSEDGNHHHNRRHSSDSNRGHYRDDNRDRDRDRRHRRHSAPSPTPTSKQVQWPSVFEDSGGSYVFDARSGLFYEAASNYFYDPKNKLYYSNEKKVYYHYCPKVKEDDKEEEGNDDVEGKRINGDIDEVGVWKEVKPEEGAMSAVATATGGDVNRSNKCDSTEGNDVSQNLVLQALQGGTRSHMANNTNGKNEKKKINICIKKKFTGSANLKKKYLETQEDTDTVATFAINNVLEEKPSLVQKTHHANITKWSTMRTEEMKVNENSNNNESNIPNDNPSRIIKMTKAGKPVCW